VETVRRTGMSGRVMFSSFNLWLLRQARRLAPEIPVGYLYVSNHSPPVLRGWLAHAFLGAHEAHHPHFAFVDERYMAWALRHHYHVNVWTVNDVDDIRRLCALNVDIIMSDYPDRVQEVLISDS
jgi:glycerophosphoryl diester phosphodiesterase